MAESFFVEPAVNGPVAAPAVENSSVRVDARAGGVHVDSQSIHRSHSLFITPIKLASNPVNDPNIAAPLFFIRSRVSIQFRSVRQRRGFAPHLYQPCKKGPALASLLQERCLYFCAFP